MPDAGDRRNTNPDSISNANAHAFSDAFPNADTLSDGNTDSISAACNNKNQVRF